MISVALLADSKTILRRDGATFPGNAYGLLDGHGVP